jgi:hypothetical protein
MLGMLLSTATAIIIVPAYTVRFCSLLQYISNQKSTVLIQVYLL